MITSLSRITTAWMPIRFLSTRPGCLLLAALALGFLLPIPLPAAGSDEAAIRAFEQRIAKIKEQEASRKKTPAAEEEAAESSPPVGPAPEPAAPVFPSADREREWTPEELQVRIAGLEARLEVLEKRADPRRPLVSMYLVLGSCLAVLFILLAIRTWRREPEQEGDELG